MNLLGEDASVIPEFSDNCPDLVEPPLKAVCAAQVDLLAGRAIGPEVLALVVIFAHHMVIGDSEDLVALLAVLGFVLMEQ